MIRLQNMSKTGQAEYTLDSASEIASLNKVGISTGSTATLMDSTGLRVFYFTSNEKMTDGTWSEL